MSIARVQYLQTTPRSKLRANLISELKTALSNIPANERESSLPLQLLEIRLKKPNCWDGLIRLWYKLDANHPEIGTILANYDLDFQHQQVRYIKILQDTLKVI